MPNILTIVALITFGTSLFARNVDPILAQIGTSLSVDLTRVVLLSSAFSFPFALIQPVLGAIADVFGKTRVMIASLVVVSLATLASAFAPTFEWLLVARVVTGLAAGGIFPVAIALVGDLVAVQGRQAAIGRILMANMIGNLLGATSSGFISDYVGWRGVFFAAFVVAMLTLVGGVSAFRNAVIQTPASGGLRAILPNYLAIVRHPLAKICFFSVFLEGVFCFGVLPHISVLLAAAGEMRASIAGVVLAGFGAGALFYTLNVSRMLGWFGEKKAMRVGGGLVLFALAALSLRLSWPLEIGMLFCLGLGWLMLHGVIQVYVTELAPQARTSAVALHTSFFFLGQAVGPLYYGYGFTHIGQTTTLILGGLGFALVALMCSMKLRRSDYAKLTS